MLCLAQRLNSKEPSQTLLQLQLQGDDDTSVQAWPCSWLGPAHHTSHFMPCVLSRHRKWASRPGRSWGSSIPFLLDSVTRKGVGEQNRERGRKVLFESFCWLSDPLAHQWVLSGFPLPQLSYHFLSSTLHPLMGYQQIPPVYAGRIQEDWTGTEEGRGRRQEGKAGLSIHIQWDIQSHIGGLREDL